MLATTARNKYCSGTFRCGGNGNEFEFLCLHAFQISDVPFVAKPLTDGAQEFEVRFPPKQALAPNWRQKENYLRANVLYIPPYDNLESGGAFCLIHFSGKWTLVILHCTSAETHQVKKNVVNFIYDSYLKSSELTIDATAIMFMTPPNGKLKTTQSLVTQKLETTQRATIAIAAQYKIENGLVTIDEHA